MPPDLRSQVKLVPVLLLFYYNDYPILLYCCNYTIRKMSCQGNYYETLESFGERDGAMAVP